MWRLLFVLGCVACAPKPAPKPEQPLPMAELWAAIKAPTVVGRVTLDGVAVQHFGIAVSQSPFPEWDRAKRVVEVHSAEGRYALNVTSGGRWNLVVAGPGFVRHIVKDVRVPIRPVAVVDIAVERGITISGTVSDSSGKPVTGAVVSTGARPRRMAPTSIRDYVNNEHHPTALTDPLGRYELTNVAPTEKAITLVATVASVGSSWHTSAPDGLRSGDATRVDLVVLPAGKITGRVINRNAESLYSVYAKSTSHPDTAFRTATDDHGSFVFDDLPAGEYEIGGRYVTIRGPDADLSRQTVTVVAGRSTEVVIQ